VAVEAFLASVVEVAIGVAGFAGIIATVRQGRIARWPHEPRILIEMLLTASASAIVFALLPTVFTEADISEPDTWRVGSLCILVWQLFFAVFRTRQFKASGVRTRAPLWLLAWVSLIVICQAVNIFLCVSWLYLIGVFGILGNGFMFFVHLLFMDWDDENTPT